MLIILPISFSTSPKIIFMDALPLLMQFSTGRKEEMGGGHQLSASAAKESQTRSQYKSH